LGRIGEPAVEPLIWVLNNPDWGVRESETATEALGRIGDRRAVEPLIRVLSNADSHVRESAAAAEALGRIGSDRAVAPLKRTLTMRIVMFEVALRKPSIRWGGLRT